MRYGRPLADRVIEKIDLSQPDDCWLWTAAVNGKGYGTFTSPGHVTKLAHRLVFEMFVGPIPDGMQLDHLCRTPACVNPDHLEVVTGAENTRRGISANGSKTRCKRGHEFTPANTVRTRDGRSCKACLRAHQRAYKDRQRQRQQVPG